jgi:hypothetical protein
VSQSRSPGSADLAARKPLACDPADVTAATQPELSHTADAEGDGGDASVGQA